MHLGKYWHKTILFGFALQCLAGILLSSCSSTLKATSSLPSHTPIQQQSSAPVPAPAQKQEVVLHKSIQAVPDTSAKVIVLPVVEEKQYSAVQLKFAQQLGIPPEQITNDSLYTFISEWLNTPYKYAGDSKNGVDCSFFTCTLYKDVFNNDITGSSRSLLANSTPVKKEDLTEGDLVFFKIKKGRVSHVGVYLANNKFVHASVKQGVTISDLTDDYYKRHFYRGGRMKT